MEIMGKFDDTAISEWVPFGDGATSTCYYHKENPGIMLKFFDQGRTGADYAEREFDLSSAVSAMSISTPKAIQTVTIDGKRGIVYERITPKISVSRLCTDNPDQFEEYARLFTIECLKFHKIQCTEDSIVSRKQQVLNALNSNHGLSKRARKFLLELANSVEDTKTCLHGDMQSGNLVSNGENFYWIDLGAFAWGNPMFDVGGMYFFYKSTLGQLLYGKIFHMKTNQLTRFWRIFSDVYSKGNTPSFDIEAAKWSLLFIVYTLSIESFSKLERTIVNLYINLSVRKFIEQYNQKVARRE